MVMKLTVRGDSLLRAFETVVAGAQPDANVSGVEIWYDPGKPTAPASNGPSSPTDAR